MDQNNTKEGTAGKPEVKKKRFLPPAEFILLAIIALSIVSIINSLITPVYHNPNRYDTLDDVFFKVELQSAEQFTFNDTKRVILSLKFINDNDYDFWFASSDLLMSTGETYNYWASNFVLTPYTMYKAPANSSITADFAWDMPAVIMPRSVMFTNNKKYGIKVDIPEVKEIEPPQALVELYEEKDLLDGEDKTEEEYNDLIDNINAFLNQDPKVIDEVKLEEIKVKMILPKAPYKYWSDSTPYPEDLFTGVESYYYPYHSFSIDPITLTPKKELTYKKYYIINYRIPSSSGTSVLNGNFEIDYDSFPKEVSSQTTDAYDELINIGDKRVHKYYHYYLDSSNINRDFTIFYVIDLDNGHTITLTYQGSLGDSLLKIDDTDLRIEIIEKIIEKLEVY